jgi:Fe-S oxidoreductase
MAKGTIRVLERCDADYIVTGGTSCSVAVIHDYPHLFRDEPEWQMRASRQAARLMDITSFLHSVARLPHGSLASGGERPLATYHYFCQAYNVLGMRNEPIDLLERVCGVRITPLPEANVCCGFGGSVSVTRPEMCKHILARKLDNVFSTGASMLVTDNPGCIMHLRGGIAAEGRKLRVAQTVEIVAEAMRAMGSRA